MTEMEGRLGDWGRKRNEGIGMHERRSRAWCISVRALHSFSRSRRGSAADALREIPHAAFKRRFHSSDTQLINQHIIDLHSSRFSFLPPSFSSPFSCRPPMQQLGDLVPNFPCQTSHPQHVSSSIPACEESYYSTVSTRYETTSEELKQIGALLFILL